MKRQIFIFGGIGFLFGFCQITGHDLAKQGNIIWSSGYVVKLFALCFLIGGAAAAAAAVFSRLSQRPGSAKQGRQHSLRGLDRLKPWQFWLCSAVLISLCWLPGYLAYYPGICSYDFPIQTGQIVERAYNDHHPILHTLMIEGCMRMGERLFGSINTGIGIMTLAQMLGLACAFAWCITFLRNRGIGRGWLLFLQGFCMFYPFHMYMAITAVKDTLFSIFFLLQVLALGEAIRRDKGKPDRFDLMFVICSLGMQFFRNNGRYAMLALQAVLLLALFLDRGSRRLWGRLAAECLAALVFGSVFLSALFRVAGAEQGDRREMLSMPIQQLARCMVYHGGIGVLPEDDGTVTETEKALIDDFLLNEAYRAYRPDIADPVKSHTNTYVVRYRTGEFLKTYFGLFKRYPGDFINAALAVNAGYLYMGDESHAVINRNGVDKGLGYVQTRWVENELNPRGIHKDSKWEWLHRVLERWADQNRYLRVPVLKYLFVPGTVLWLYLLLLGSLAARRRYGAAVPPVLAMGYYLTMFLGPTVQLRYVYPLAIVLPFIALSVKKVSYGDAEKQ